MNVYGKNNNIKWTDKLSLIDYPLPCQTLELNIIGNIFLSRTVFLTFKFPLATVGKQTYGYPIRMAGRSSQIERLSDNRVNILIIY